MTYDSRAAGRHWTPWPTSGSWWSPPPATTPPAGRCCRPGSAPIRNGQLLTGRHDTVPLVSVGALNPDGSVALFSNGGDWVACHSPGAALVSTLPQVDSGSDPGSTWATTAPGERAVASWRATVDPDSFTGFGTWSGTSFAAPVTGRSRCPGTGRRPEESRFADQPSCTGQAALDSPGLRLAEQSSTSADARPRRRSRPGDIASVYYPPGGGGGAPLRPRGLLAEHRGMDRGDLSRARSAMQVRALAACSGCTSTRPRPDPSGPRQPESGARRRLAARILLSLAFPPTSSASSGRAAGLRRRASAPGAPMAEHTEIRVLIYGQRGAMFLREGRLLESRVELNRGGAPAGLRAGRTTSARS